MKQPKQRKDEELDTLLNQPNHGIVREFIDFARANRKLWLVPLFLLLLLFGALIILGGSSAAPFIYRLF
jgi:hypothetical protein